MKKQTHTPWYVAARCALKERNITYAQLAKELGVERQTVGHWLTGRNSPRIETIQRIARILHMSVSELVGEDKYFVIDEKEREMVDAIRKIPARDREVVLRLIKSAATKENAEKE